MAPKKNPKRGPQKPRTQANVFVSDITKQQILSKVNDRRYAATFYFNSNSKVIFFRECLFGETTPTNTMHMKHTAWMEVLDFCHSVGANYPDVHHLKINFGRWKKAYLSKKEESKKTGGGGTKFVLTPCDIVMRDIVYGSSEKDTIEVNLTIRVFNIKPEASLRVRPTAT